MDLSVVPFLPLTDGGVPRASVVDIEASWDMVKIKIIVMRNLCNSSSNLSKSTVSFLLWIHTCMHTQTLVTWKVRRLVFRSGCEFGSSALYPLLSTLCSLLSALYRLVFTLCSVASALYPLLFTLCSLPSALYPPALYPLFCTLCSGPSALYPLLFTLCSLPSALYPGVVHYAAPWCVIALPLYFWEIDPWAHVNSRYFFSIYTCRREWHTQTFAFAIIGYSGFGL